ncbi:hypothetical protein AB0C98_41715, partial [Streptomyces sp. NPDC048558]|uniref:hypothetical protein n=1 Tax=Streptomyces sp. NPDC048558 TaxID=3155759 RepID=UPI0034158C32
TLGAPTRALITHAAGRAARRYARQRGWTPSTQQRFELAARTAASLLTSAAFTALDAAGTGELLLNLACHL